MAKKKVKGIGLIVEDDSDFGAFKILIERIVNKNNLTFKKAIGDGCGKLRRKAASYVQTLSARGCNMIILVHDLDRNDLKELQNHLNQLIADSPADYNFVCIPIEEIEGWFLSDPQGIKDTFTLKRLPNITGNPQTINSPKERLEDIVLQTSNKTKIYLNTKHNHLLAQNVSIEKMRAKCKSFEAFHEFLTEHTF